MLEAEEYCHLVDPNKYVATARLSFKIEKLLRERLYFATGYGLIQCVKGLMSFEDKVRGTSDLLLACYGH